MSLRANTLEELKRTPVTIAIALFGLVIGAGSLLLAWIQFSMPTLVPATSGGTQHTGLNFSNLLVSIAFCLGSSLAFTLFIRLLARAHWFAAAVISVPIAVLSAFGTMLVLHMLPPKAFTSEAFSMVQDVVLWSTCTVFIAFNGRPVCQAIAETNNGQEATDKQGGGGMLFTALILLAAWSGMVSAGLSKMVRGFLL